MSLRALVILHPGFEELEAAAPIDLFARADIEVTQAAIGDSLCVSGRNSITLKATHLFTELAAELFDVVLLPGGPGILELRKHPELCKSLRAHHAHGKLVACICAAPLILKDADLLQDHTYTAHPSTIEELPSAIDKPVVQSGSIITSRGAGTATELGLSIVAHLCGHATAQSIADSICWTHPL